jgi:hypothetical protein
VLRIKNVKIKKNKDFPLCLLIFLMWQIAAFSFVIAMNMIAFVCVILLLCCFIFASRTKKIILKNYAAFPLVCGCKMGLGWSESQTKHWDLVGEHAHTFLKVGKTKNWASAKTQMNWGPVTKQLLRHNVSWSCWVQIVPMHWITYMVRSLCVGIGWHTTWGHINHTPRSRTHAVLSRA